LRSRGPNYFPTGNEPGIFIRKLQKLLLLRLK